MRINGRASTLAVAAASASPTSSISIKGPIGSGGATASRVISDLGRCAGRDIVVEIDSMGGDFMDGAAIYSALAAHRGRKTVRVTGTAASAAALIAMAGDRIEISPRGSMMVHRTSGTVTGGQAKIAAFAKFMRCGDDLTVAILAKRTGRPPSSFVALMDDETWLRGEAAVKAGLADALIPEAPTAPSWADPKLHAAIEALTATIRSMSRGEARLQLSV